MAGAEPILTPAQMASLLVKQERLIKLMTAALGECEAYFDDRAEADYQGEEDGFVGNAEMRLLTEVREALGKGGF